MKQASLGIEDIISLIETLRGETGCPWDKKQTPSTMATYLVEEVFELIDTIASGSPDEVCEELGDVLFQVLFIARLFKEMGHFDIQDIANMNAEKMIRRHPHVFGNEDVDNAEGARNRWHKIKRKEKDCDQKESILNSVPVGLPALMRAYRISERAARTGFDWDDISGVVKKVEEEWSEFKTELTKNNQNGKDRPEEDQDRLALEFGDLLFTLVNVARFARIHPETALADSTRKFEKRFKYMEKVILGNGRHIESASSSEMNILWEEVKKKLNS